MFDVVMPELPEGVTEATVSYWRFEEGDTVNEGDDLVEMTTDKAVFNIPVPRSGKLAEVFVEEGETVKVGQLLANIEET
jgi:2-oxoglutarate dehydrogenase E2 component (dihydrolipoamide succinyltransferase)